MSNLVTTFIAAETSNGEPITLALNALNECLGSNYNLSRLGDWRRGDRSIPQPVQNYMLKMCIHHVLTQQIGAMVMLISDEQLDAIADALTPPKAIQK